jgi:hypothetical protein
MNSGTLRRVPAAITAVRAEASGYRTDTSSSPPAMPCS